MSAISEPIDKKKLVRKCTTWLRWRTQPSGEPVLEQMVWYENSDFQMVCEGWEAVPLDIELEIQE